MPNDSMLKKPKASRGLVDYFRPAIDTVAAMDPTDTLLQLISGVRKAESPPAAVEGDYNFIPSAPEMDPMATEMMNRQNKIKQTFGKIPGR